MNYPWLAAGQEQFARLHANLPHALLVHGQRGIGKHALAIEMVGVLLCEQPQHTGPTMHACGQCRNCIMFESENHPDFHFISSEYFIENSPGPHLSYAQRYLDTPPKRGKRKARKGILVDQIRALIDNFSLSNHSAALKVALLEPAEAMNVSAANALLKLLEEPGEDSVLILVSHDISQLPMTIRSRCIALSLHSPGHDQALAWLHSQGLSEINAQKALAISGGGPLLALSYRNSNDIDHFEALLAVLSDFLSARTGAIETRNKIRELESPQVLLSWLLTIVGWLIQSQQLPQAQPSSPWYAHRRSLAELVRGLEPTRLPALFALYDDLLAVKRQDIDVVDFALQLDQWLIMLERRLR